MVCLLFLIPRARSGPLRSKTFQEILILAFRANCAAFLKHSFSDFSPFWDSNFLYKSFSEFFLELYQSDYNLDSWFAYLIYLTPVNHTIYMYMFCFLINGYIFLRTLSTFDPSLKSQPRIHSGLKRDQYSKSKNSKQWAKILKNMQFIGELHCFSQKDFKFFKWSKKIF